MYMYKRSARIDHYTTCKSIIVLKRGCLFRFLLIIPQGGGQDFFGRLKFLKGKRGDGGNFRRQEEATCQFFRCH